MNKQISLAQLRPLVKCHGGKHYLARRIISLFPDQVATYVEPFVGGGSVFLNLNPDLYQDALLNDLDAGTYHLWKVMTDPDLFKEFHEWACDVAYAEATFLAWRDMEPTGPLEHAMRHFCVSRMSRGGMGKAFAWSDRLRGGQPGDANAWRTAIDQLPRIHERIVVTGAEVTNLDALKLLEAASQPFGNPDDLYYLDPPYYHPTRKSKKVYTHEMSHDQHVRLLDLIKVANCRVMISGYSCDLYEDMLAGWHRHEFDLPNHAGQTGIKQRRTEVVWCNWNN